MTLAEKLRAFVDRYYGHTYLTGSPAAQELLSLANDIERLEQRESTITDPRNAHPEPKEEPNA